MEKFKKYTKYFFLSLGVIYGLYYLFYSISQEDAEKIAGGVLSKWYTKTCGGGFEENLIMKRTKAGDFEFTSENGKCEIFIHINRFGTSETGLIGKD